MQTNKKEQASTLRVLFGHGFAHQMIESMRANRAALGKGDKKNDRSKSRKIALGKMKTMNRSEFTAFSNKLRYEARRERQRKFLLFVGAILVIITSIYLLAPLFVI